MKLYLDIETLPCADPAFIAQVSDTITAPAQYKKPESIAEWLRDNKEQAVKDSVSKTSFDGLYGSIACICYAFDDGEVFSVDARCGEKLMLEKFYCHVLDMTGVDHESGTAYQQLVVVGHNVAGFDLPFIKHRSIINNVKPVYAILKHMSAKPWDACIADTMLMWSSDSQKRVSMDKLCKAFGLEGKGDFDGSMVAETWPKEPMKVIGYCMDDVRRTRELYKCMTWDQSFKRSSAPACDQYRPVLQPNAEMVEPVFKSQLEKIVARITAANYTKDELTIIEHCMDRIDSMRVEAA